MGLALLEEGPAFCRGRANRFHSALQTLPDFLPSSLRPDRLAPYGRVGSRTADPDRRTSGCAICNECRQLRGCLRQAPVERRLDTEAIWKEYGVGGGIGSFPVVDSRQPSRHEAGAALRLPAPCSRMPSSDAPCIIAIVPGCPLRGPPSPSAPSALDAVVKSVASQMRISRPYWDGPVVPACGDLSGASPGRPAARPPGGRDMPGKRELGHRQEWMAGVFRGSICPGACRLH